ncbi:MAG TPA: lipoyl(octanoyl) transferase LipB [Candidatus Hydrogenedens sp.]|jgi:lipoate-protein ligase B|nr:lipoyl(octanoyl) transferase LipB [Candidatus Hydrogenedens sp.]
MKSLQKRDKKAEIRSMLEVLIYKNPQDYDTIYQQQIERRDKLQNGMAEEYLILLEHTPVFTAGRQFQQEHLLISPELCKERGIRFLHADRGGDITYHGPGQLVGYPILNLATRAMSVHQYIRKLEEAIMDTLACYHISTQTIKSLTGVWVENRKIAAIGIGVKNSITWHGFSININLDLTPFQWIIPCGISDKKVTSLKNELNRNRTCPTREEFIRIFLPIFCKHFCISELSITEI